MVSERDRRAVVCFVEDNEHLIQQTLALRRSWLRVASPDTDLVVFGPPQVLERLPADIVKIQQRPVADDPEWGGYRYANGIAYLNGPQAYRLDGYSHILHTNVDTFLAPGWNDFHPAGFVCGTGAYVNDDETGQRLKDIAATFGLTHRGFSNAGPTWYGPTALVRRTAALAEMLTRYILATYFRERAFIWPGWYWGVSSLYGGEIAINHCAPDVQRSALLDMSCSSLAVPVGQCVHIHSWHGDRDFSKHRFMAGGYRDTDVRALNLDAVPDYALAMSLASLEDLAPPPAPVPAADPGAGASPALAEAAPEPSPPPRCDADEAVRRLLQIELGERPVEEAPGLLALPGDDLARAAEYHGVTSFIAPLVKAHNPPLARLWAILESRHRRAAAAQMVCLNLLLDALEAASIPAVVLKGRALAEVVYARPDLRPAVDIDLLVGRDDLRRAADVARAQGFGFATGHGSRFAGRVHRLPAASRQEGGFEVQLELHDDALAPNSGSSLTLAELSAPLMPFPRAPGRTGLMLGPADMLRHLTRHAFEPTARVRLKHLLDLWLYRRHFAAEIAAWQDARLAPTLTALDMAELALRRDPPAGEPLAVSGVGRGMTPLSSIGQLSRGEQLAALFNPPEWWLRGYYGVPAGAPLGVARTVRHPLTVARWLARRAWVGLGLSDPHAMPQG